MNHPPTPYPLLPPSGSLWPLHNNCYCVSCIDGCAVCMWVRVGKSKKRKENDSEGRAIWISVRCGYSSGPEVYIYRSAFLSLLYSSASSSS